VIPPNMRGYALNQIAELSNTENDENLQTEVEEFIQKEVENTEKILLQVFK
jgi:hypothetical protein